MPKIFPGKDNLDSPHTTGTLTRAAGDYSRQEFPSELEEPYYRTLNRPVKTFFKTVGGSSVDDKATLDLALQAHNSARSSASEGKLRKVLKALETALLKDKNSLSDGLTYSLCILAFVSNIDAKILVWRTQRKCEDSKLVDTKIKERESALEALFSPIKPSQKRDCLLLIQGAAGVEVDWETSPGASQKDSFNRSIKSSLSMDGSVSLNSSEPEWSHVDATCIEPGRDSHLKTVQGTMGSPEPPYQGRGLEFNPVFTDRAESEHLAHTGASAPLQMNTYDNTENPQRLAGDFSSVAPSRADNFGQSQHETRFHKTRRATRSTGFMDLSEDTPEDAFQDEDFQLAGERTNHEGSNIMVPGQERRDLFVGHAQQQKADVISLVRPDISAVNGAASHPYSPSRRALKVMEHRDYTVGWICALPEELAAAAAMLDEGYDSLPQGSHDINNYRLGQIGGHNVVITCLPSIETGIISAATVASYLLSTFPLIRFVLMIGIGGGVPSATKDI
ncbi:MAG: hypothetical protein ALECFALPRED_004665 [Alectoria fallacina]|uniref:Nucleoside phosphorylase domain-containing protein n=1 Tax=Alectoria fallacina TaxID=1903189 RepID=A0A8H3ETB0_9LECA|nr:MAG: hypothetical protein ALECFALPRED_004665 [Alectoria fallacina]